MSQFCSKAAVQSGAVVLRANVTADRQGLVGVTCKDGLSLRHHPYLKRPRLWRTLSPLLYNLPPLHPSPALTHRPVRHTFHVCSTHNTTVAILHVCQFKLQDSHFKQKSLYLHGNVEGK